MTRGDTLLQQLRSQLFGWAGAIKRATGAVDLQMPLVPGDGFVLRITWKNGQTYERHYSREYVFGRTYPFGEAAWTVQKRGCDYARDFMREVLEHRGVM